MGTSRDILLDEIDELKEEIAVLSIENKYLARHLLQNGYNKEQVDHIAKGFDDWVDK
tara:strand:+ start:451 stop:621 length:171 start_codon:yes stop_codon:yes gene_type:complete